MASYYRKKSFRRKRRKSNYRSKRLYARINRGGYRL